MESAMLNVQDIIASGRWDYDYNQVKYIDFEKRLRTLQTASLQSLCNQLITKGETPLWKGDKYVTEADGVLFIRSENIRGHGLDLNSKTFISTEVHKRMKRSRIQSGDILLAIVGATIGQVAVVPNEVSEANCNQAVAIIRPKENTNPHYLRAILQSSLGQTQIHRLSGGTARPNLDLWEARILRIPVVSRSLQDQIAQVMQEAYSDRQKKLKEAEKSFLGIETYVHEVLNITRDFPIDEPRFLVNQSQLHRWDVRFFLPSFSHLEDLVEQGKYSTKSLFSVCEKITNGLTPAKVGYTDEGCVVVKVASLTKLFQINWDKVAFTSTEFFKKAKKAHLKDGDLLVLSASHQLDYIGRSFALVRDIPADYVDQCMAVGELVLIRTNSQLVLPEYLLACFTMQSIQKLINRMTRGQSAHLYAEDLQHLKIPVPPLDIQQQIVDEMDRRRGKTKQLRSQAEAVVTAAKARVERMILGEEEVQGDSLITLFSI
jgi:restriction endonuclease S subunit